MRYAVVGRLGRGGMGVVDLATDPDGRRVALKRLALHGSAPSMAEARRRIRREAEALASLDHPGVVPLLEVVDDGDDVVLVMPYFEGGSLRDALATSGPLPADRVAELGDQLLGALAAVHRQGIVHRDIKPSNVLLDGAGRAVLADFGVALVRDSTEGLTATGAVVGTAAFMAPEQARGEPAGPAADVFALGATLRWALTGEGPYGEGEPVALAHRAAAGKVTRLPREVPARLRRLVAAACTPDPARRPTAAALAGGPEGTALHTAVQPGRQRRGRRRSRSFVALAAAAVVVAGVVLAAATMAILDRDSGTAATPDPPVTEPTAPPCTDRPYQPCGEGPAPGTDGDRCLAGRDDYDGDPTSGCEAETDGIPDGSVIDRDAEVTANLVPRDDVDSWRYEVGDGFQLLCDGRVDITFAAAPGVAQQLQVLDGEEVLATTSSADATPVSLSLGDPNCFGSDATTLTLVVSSVGSDRSSESYRLRVRGSY